LKLKNYNFTSTNDVFENRNEDNIQKSKFYGYNKETLPEKQKLTKEERQRLAYEIKREKKRSYAVT
jgi:hypothetical protein